MSSENHLLKKTVQLVKYLGTAIPDAECDEEAILAVYVHLQQAASVLMDQQIRHETKTKGEESKTGSSPKIQFGIPPKVTYRLVYQSQLVFPKGKTPVDTILPIINFATTNNQKLGVGGMLFCDVIDGKVIQVLEGDKSVVQPLFANISVDKRHKDIVVIQEEVTRDRKYKSWGMQFAQTVEDWATVVSVIKTQRSKGLVRAKGFGSFDNLKAVDSGLKRVTPFGRLSSFKNASQQ
ncbi:hypothetical protein AAMO2058_001718700 [Amorphochlora amoebiformis]